MKKWIYIVVIILLTLAFLAFIFWSFSQGGSTLFSGPKALPVPYNAPSVKGAAIVYSFEGTINKLTGTPNGIVIDSDIKGNGIPPLIVKNGTPIFVFSSGQKYYTNVSSLKPYEKITVSAIYDLQKSHWTLMEIDLMNAPIPNTNNNNTYIPSITPYAVSPSQGPKAK